MPMPFYFQPFSHSAVDPVNNVSVLRPRILPATLMNGVAGTEYHYSLYRGDDRIGGLGLIGSDEVVEHGGVREHVFWLDLAREQVIRALLDYKQDFGATDEDFAYLRGIAHGLVVAFAGRTENEENLRYVAVTSIEALSAAGVLISDGTSTREDGTLVLAEVVVSPGVR